MHWPLMWRATHDSLMQAQRAYSDLRFIQASGDASYWKLKAERLLDMALFKRGEITAPVFQEREKPRETTDPMLKILGAMQVREVETLKRPAEPVTPMS